MLPRCSVCDKPKSLITIKTDINRSTSFIGCKNKRCSQYKKQPAPIGSCGSKDSFTYRAGANMAKAQEERRQAEAAQGSSPYNPIDDISSGVHFGKVK